MIWQLHHLASLIVTVSLVFSHYVRLSQCQRFHFGPPTMGNCSSTGSDTVEERFHIICYVGLWYTEVHFGSFTGDTIDPFLCTHLIVAYYEINRRNWDLLMPSSPLAVDLLEKVEKLKVINPNVRVLLSMGGYNDNKEDPEKYVQLTSNGDNTRTFVENVIHILCSNRIFDGVDFQWNYPGRHRISNPDEDRELFGIFTKRFCKRVREERLVCMVTIQRPRHEIANMTKTVMAFEKIIQYADLVHIWTADIPPEPTAFREMYHTDLLYPPPQGTYLYHNNSEYTVDTLVKFFTSKVLKNDLAKRKKLVLTIPMQANSFQLSEYPWRDPWPVIQGEQDLQSIPKPPDLGENTMTGYETGLEQYPFYEICRRLYLLPVTDPKKLFLYSHFTQNGTDSTPVAYSKTFFVPANYPPSVRDKVKYAKAMGLGGVSVFQIGADDWRGWCYNQTYPLLNAVYQEVHNCQ